MSSPLSKRIRKGRLSCRMDSDLLDWIHWYAANRGVTVTQLIEDHFKHLRRNYRNRNKIKVEQL